MEVEKVSIPLFAADYAWKVDYKVPDNVRLGVRLAKKNAGVVIMEVMQNTNAERAGILKGDVLLSMDGKKISLVEEVLEQLQTKKFEDSSTLQIHRNGKEQNVKVKFIK